MKFWSRVSSVFGNKVSDNASHSLISGNDLVVLAEFEYHLKSDPSVMRSLIALNIEVLERSPAVAKDLGQALAIWLGDATGSPGDPLCLLLQNLMEECFTRELRRSSWLGYLSPASTPGNAPTRRSSRPGIMPFRSDHVECLIVTNFIKTVSHCTGILTEWLTPVLLSLDSDAGILIQQESRSGFSDSNDENFNTSSDERSVNMESSWLAGSGTRLDDMSHDCSRSSSMTSADDSDGYSAFSTEYEKERLYPKDRHISSDNATRYISAMLFEKLRQTLPDIPHSIRAVFVCAAKLIFEAGRDSSESISGIAMGCTEVQNANNLDEPLSLYNTCCSSLLFLRMIVPALLSPRQWGVIACWYAPASLYYGRSIFRGRRRERKTSSEHRASSLCEATSDCHSGNTVCPEEEYGEDNCCNEEDGSKQQRGDKCCQDESGGLSVYRDFRTECETENRETGPEAINERNLGTQENVHKDRIRRGSDPTVAYISSNNTGPSGTKESDCVGRGGHLRWGPQAGFPMLNRIRSGIEGGIQGVQSYFLSSKQEAPTMSRRASTGGMKELKYGLKDLRVPVDNATGGLAVDDFDDPMDSRATFLKMTANRPSAAAMVIMANLLITAWESTGRSSTSSKRNDEPILQEDDERRGSYLSSDVAGINKDAVQCATNFDKDNRGIGNQCASEALHEQHEVKLDTMYILAKGLSKNLNLHYGCSLVANFNKMAFPPVVDDIDDGNVPSEVSSSVSHQAGFDRPGVRKGLLTVAKDVQRVANLACYMNSEAASTLASMGGHTDQRSTGSNMNEEDAACADCVRDFYRDLCHDEVASGVQAMK